LNSPGIPKAVADAVCPSEYTDETRN